MNLTQDKYNKAPKKQIGMLCLVAICYLSANISHALNGDMTPLVISESKDTFYLGHHYSAFLDEEKKYNIDEVVSGKHNDKFHLINDRITNFGFNKGTVWIQFSIKNPLNIVKPLMVEFNYAFIEHIDFFYFSPLNELKRITTGSAYPFSSRPIKDGMYVFPIEVMPNSTATYYLRLQSHEPIAVPLSIRTPLAHMYQSKVTKFILGGILGAILSLMLYNLFLYTVFHDKAYIYYVLFVFFSALYHMASYGLPYQIWPEFFSFNNRIRDTSAAIALIFATQFGRIFFQSKYHLNKFDYVLKASVILPCITLISTIVYGPNQSAILIPISVIITVILLIILSTNRLLHGYKPARFFLLGWTALMVAVITFPLSNFNLIKFNIFRG